MNEENLKEAVKNIFFPLFIAENSAPREMHQTLYCLIQIFFYPSLSLILERVLKYEKIITYI